MNDTLTVFGSKVLDGTETVDDVFDYFSDHGCSLRVGLLERNSNPGDDLKPYVVIEGDRRALAFLAYLLLAQSADDQDCGIGLSPDAPGAGFFEPSSKFGIYVHSLPCRGHTKAGEGTAAQFWSE